MRQAAVFLIAGILNTLLCSLPALAVTIGLVPGSQTVGVGLPASVDVVVSGFGVGLGPSLGAFDLDVSYDDSILAATGVTFGPFLGDPGLGEAILGFDVSVPGLVDFFEVSLLLPFELDVLQPGSFPLATISFDTVGVGASSLSFSEAVLGDAFGQPLDVTSAQPGSIRVVPEPASWNLLLAGLALVAQRLIMRRLARAGARAEKRVGQTRDSKTSAAVCSSPLRTWLS